MVVLEEAKKVMESGEKRDDAVDEIADVIIYAFAFCIRNNIDISDAIRQKMKKNIQKYPKENSEVDFRSRQSTMNRIISIDVFRGVTMFLMLWVNDFWTLSSIQMVKARRIW